MLSVTVNLPKGVKTMDKRVKEGIKQGVFDSSLEVKNSMQDYVPRKTSTLYRWIIIDYPKSNEAFVGIKLSNVPYARIQEQGGIILPKNKKFLRFVINGVPIFAKRVVIKPKRYIKRAFEDNKDLIPQIISDRIKKFLQRS